MGKAGYVRTSRGKGKVRLYEVSGIVLAGGGNIGLYDFINLHSPLKLAKPYEHIIYGRQITAEEAIVRATENI